jgi:hypothetical protein
MSFRRRLWAHFKLAPRKRPVLHPHLPYALDEFARLLSSRNPTTLKQLAAGLGRPAGVSATQAENLVGNLVRLRLGISKAED